MIDDPDLEPSDSQDLEQDDGDDNMGLNKDGEDEVNDDADETYNDNYSAANEQFGRQMQLKQFGNQEGQVGQVGQVGQGRQGRQGRQGGQSTKFASGQHYDSRHNRKNQKGGNHNSYISNRYSNRTVVSYQEEEEEETDDDDVNIAQLKKLNDRLNEKLQDMKEESGGEDFDFGFGIDDMNEMNDIDAKLESVDFE